MVSATVRVPGRENFRSDAGGVNPGLVAKNVRQTLAETRSIQADDVQTGQGQRDLPYHFVGIALELDRYPTTELGVADDSLPDLVLHGIIGNAVGIYLGADVHLSVPLTGVDGIHLQPL